MLKKALIFLAALSSCTLAFSQAQRTIVYPAEAIQDSAKLKRTEFDKLYPGIDITNIGLVDEGWYVRYNHEQLIYLFGPFDDLDFARIQKQELEQVRLNIVLKNPKLSSSTIDLIRFEFKNFNSTDDSDNIKAVN